MPLKFRTLGMALRPHIQQEHVGWEGTYLGKLWMTPSASFKQGCMAYQHLPYCTTSGCMHWENLNPTACIAPNCKLKYNKN